MTGYFIFNGKDSRNYHCYLESMPARTKPPKAFKEYMPDGMDGSYIQEFGYKSYDKQLKIGITDTKYVDNVISWLDGQGKITFGDETDKYYNVSFLEQVDYEKLLRFRKATVTARFKPFKYLVNDITYNNGNVLNKGNTNAKPILTIEGSGTCVVYVNDVQTCTISELPIIIDSEQMYSSYGGVNKNRKKTGDYISLKPGNNVISVVGDSVDSIKVERCSRWV